MNLELTDQEAEDIRSALGFFVENYPDQKGSVETRQDMRALSVRILAWLQGEHAPTLRELQKEVIDNRTRRGWPSAHDLMRTTLGLAEEVGEFEKARKRGDNPGQVHELTDIIVFALGGLELLNADALTEVWKVVEENKTRTHNGVH